MTNFWNACSKHREMSDPGATCPDLAPCSTNCSTFIQRPLTKFSVRLRTPLRSIFHVLLWLNDTSVAHILTNFYSFAIIYLRAKSGCRLILLVNWMFDYKFILLKMFDYKLILPTWMSDYGFILLALWIHSIRVPDYILILLFYKLILLWVSVDSFYLS